MGKEDIDSSDRRPNTAGDAPGHKAEVTQHIAFTPLRLSFLMKRMFSTKEQRAI